MRLELTRWGLRIGGKWELYVLIRDGLDEGIRRVPEAMAGSIYISVDGQFRSKSCYSTSE